MENFKIDIPSGNSREEIRVRDKAIKDFYSSWNGEHPEKKIWNADLNDYIHVRNQETKYSTASLLLVNKKTTARAVVIVLGLETVETERVVIPYANSPMTG